MKKLIASTLLAIYLFNIGGQLVLHRYFSYLAARYFVEQARKGFYNVNDLTEVKIPTNLPNIADWTSYENITGQIQFENTNYNYVKMKLTRTAIYLMCVPDYTTTQFTQQNIISAKQVKGSPVPQKNHVPYGKALLLNNLNFEPVNFAFSPPFKGPVIVKAVQSCHQVINHSPDVPEQPPKFSC